MYPPRRMVMLILLHGWKSHSVDSSVQSAHPPTCPAFLSPPPPPPLSASFFCSAFSFESPNTSSVFLHSYVLVFLFDLMCDFSCELSSLPMFRLLIDDFNFWGVRRDAPEG